jgi:hypothetical protein
VTYLLLSLSSTTTSSPPTPSPRTTNRCNKTSQSLIKYIQNYPHYNMSHVRACNTSSPLLSEHSLRASSIENTSTLRLINNIIIIINFSGSAAQRGPWPPRSRGFLITHNDAPQSVGHLLDKWSACRRDLALTTHHPQHTNSQAPGGGRTHDHSTRAAVDLRLRPRGHWDRLILYYRIKLLTLCEININICTDILITMGYINRIHGKGSAGRKVDAQGQINPFTQNEL